MKINHKYKKLLIIGVVILVLFIIANSFYFYFDQKQKSYKIKTQDLDCIPFYQKKISSCDVNNFQIVTIKDLNYCVQENIYQKKCQTNNTEMENLLMNVYDINVTKQREYYYTSKILPEYEVVATNIDVGEYAIVLNENNLDNITREYYLKSFYDSSFPDKNLYLVIKVDEDLLESKELEIVGILPKNTLKELWDAFLTGESLATVIFVISGLLFFVFIFSILDHIKYIHRYVIYNAYLKNNSDKIQHLHDKYSDEEINKYSIYLKQVRDYVHLNKYLGRKKLKDKLEEAGWHDDLIDLVLKNEIPNEE